MWDDSLLNQPWYFQITFLVAFFGLVIHQNVTRESDLCKVENSSSGDTNVNVHVDQREDAPFKVHRNEDAQFFPKVTRTPIQM